MTAEVVILNKNGIAMAADSAVSIGRRKVYNSANKLFALSRKQPIGIMIYGSAQFMGIPWEALIKYFRKNILKNSSYASVDEYAKEFIKFLSTTKLIPSENEEMHVIQTALSCIMEFVGPIDNAIKDVIEQNGKISVSMAKSLANSEIDAWLKRQKDRSVKRECTVAQAKYLKKTFEAKLKAFIAAHLTRLGTTQAFQTKILAAILLKLSSTEPGSGRTGVVFAGFGTEDIYPFSIAYDICGRFNGFLRSRKNREQKINGKLSASILPFAQSEMVHTFMRGIDPSFFSAINTKLEQIFEDVPKAILAKYGFVPTTKQEASMRDDYKKVFSAVTSELTKIQQEKFISPVLDSVAALPIDELAAMAESLVSLTSFKRKVTMVPESVGGPVDVAVITKGDGFIWIKRKHYFKPELNPYYFQLDV
ncbi:hypothetical protein BCF11_3407 [Collimonas sp. PA-H2]|uniref:hypothetical protein n=1 Tax=Collimonas sp. PA-H2 TaxID=1881062 RepID=UPI000C019928|nr:hypothetical protein [Collimonas sp. PA-H2]PFH10969.1 hypothetical protein BCF11_3407 [Collimonas sp. PA-H2]